jgi:deazaflavin-dependent oxidoreductase (nitroreductase family)
VSNPVTGAFRWLGHRKWVSDTGRALVPADRWLHRVSGGRLSFMRIFGVPGLTLTTVGAKSGLPREVPLLYAPHGGGYLVTASNWGRPNHPAWSGNLIASPEATVQIGRREIPVVAELAEGARREELWSVVTRVWPAYDTYEARSGRDIRVFFLKAR